MGLSSSQLREGRPRHGSIIWALLLRELATRFGRDNIGFLWLIAEPLLFCAGVVGLWTLVKPPFEHGLRIAPFVVTGYMPIILVRHMINQALNCVQANGSLLYHRQITLLHLYLSRMILEFVGVTLAFALVVMLLAATRLAPLPRNPLLLFAGWGLLAWLSAGLALLLAALSEIAAPVERFVALFTYVLVPMSGTFYMVSWLPEQFRSIVLYLPFIHPVEMVRGGFFGRDVTALYQPGYAVEWAALLTFVGLLLLGFVRKGLEIE